MSSYLGGARSDSTHGTSLLDHDYFSVPEEEINEIEVEMTIVGGKIVYEKAAS